LRFDQTMFAAQAPCQCRQLRFIAHLEAREDMALLVLVVQRLGDVEIAHHVACRLARLRRVALRLQVRHEAGQQAQAAAHARVTRFEQRERFFETRGDAAAEGAIFGCGVRHGVIVRAEPGPVVL
jgi:hypothetical protein